MLGGFQVVALLGAEGGGAEHFQRAEDAVHGRADLVAQGAEEQGLLVVGLVRQQLGLQQRLFGHLEVGHVADAAQHRRHAVVAGGGTGQLDEGAVVQGMFDGMHPGRRLVEDALAQAGHRGQPAAPGFIAQDQPAVVASHQAQAYRRHLDEAPVEGHAVCQGAVVAHCGFHQAQADVARAEKDHREQKQGHQQRGVQRATAVAQQLADRCVVHQAPAGVAHGFIEHDVVGQPAQAVQAEGVLVGLQARQAAGHLPVGAVQHQCAVGVIQQVFALVQAQGGPGPGRSR